MANERNEFERKDGRLRNPQNKSKNLFDKKLSPLAEAAKRAKYESKTFDKSADEREIVAAMMMTQHEAPLVRTYIADFQKLVAEFDGPTVQMRKIIPMIEEIMGFAAKDKNLDDKGKTRVKDRGKELIDYINRRTALTTRVTNKLKAVAKEKVSNAVDSVHGFMSRSDTLLGKGIGALIGGAKSIANRDTGKEAQQEALNTRASVFQNIASGMTGQPSKGRSGAQKLDPAWLNTNTGEDKTKKPKVERAPKKAKVGVETEGTLDAILTTDKDILKQLEIQTQLLRTNGEMSEQLTEEKKRGRDVADGKALAKAKTASGKVVKDGGESGGLFGGMKGFFGKLLEFVGGMDLLGGLFKGLAGAFKILLPILTGLGEAAAVIGVAWAGWKVGSWVAKMMGLGDSGDALAKLLDTKSQSIGSSLDSLANAAEEGAKHLLHKAGIGKGSQEDQAKDDNIKIQAQQRSKGKIHAKAQDWNLKEAQSYLDGLPKMEPKAPEKPVGQAVAKAAPALDSNALPNFAPSLPTLPGMSAKPTPPAAPQSPERAQPEQMHVSDAGLDKLTKREGFTAEPKWDVNGWSIGFGDHSYNGMPLGSDKNQKPDVKIDREQAKQMLRDRLTSKYEPIVRSQLTKSVSQNQFDSLVSVAYNSEAAGKRLAQRLNRGENLQAKDFLASGTIHGMKDAGLQKRRGSEFAQFTSPDRDARPMLSATNASNTGHAGVIAPTVVVAGGKGGQSTVFIPMPLSADNPNPVVRAIRDANSV